MNSSKFMTVGAAAAKLGVSVAGGIDALIQRDLLHPIRAVGSALRLFDVQEVELCLEASSAVPLVTCPHCGAALNVGELLGRHRWRRATPEKRAEVGRRPCDDRGIITMAVLARLGGIWNNPHTEVHFRCLRCLSHDELANGDAQRAARWNPTRGAWHCDACGGGGNADNLGGRLGIPFRSTRKVAMNEAVLGPPKSDSSYRTLDLAPELVHALKVWRLQAPASELVFPNQTGRQMHHAFLHKGLRRALDACPGLPRVDLHGLRHSFASIAISQLRLPPTQVSKLLGHKDASITLDTDSYWFEGLSSEGAMGDLAAAICTPRGDQMVTSAVTGDVTS